MPPTPVILDSYNRAMARAFDERPLIAVPTGFQSFFGRPGTGALTLYSPNALTVDIDIVRGNERVAALIKRGTTAGVGNNLSNPQGVEHAHSAFSRVYPLIEEKSPITSDMVAKRLAGENPYQPRSKLAIQRELAMQISMEQRRKVVRRFEVMAAESILTGKVTTITGGGASLQYDFLRNSNLAITVGTVWSNVAADGLADLDNGCDQLRSYGHVKPDICIMAGDAFTEFIALTKVLSAADNRRYGLVQVGAAITTPLPSNLSFMLTAGFDLVAYVVTPKGRPLFIFVYNEEYTADNGTQTKYMTAGKVILMNSGARFDRYFGPNDQLDSNGANRAFMQSYLGFNVEAPPMPMGIRNDAVVSGAMFYSDAYPTDNEGKSVTIRTQAAYIPATTQTDAVAVLTV